MVRGTFPSTIKVSPTWWETIKQPVIYASTAAQVIASLSFTDMDIQALKTENDRAYLLLE